MDVDGAVAALRTAVTSTPLGLLVAGGSAVRLFFVLSGFVLALPFVAGRSVRYRTFAARRWVRLWVPYAAVLVLAVLLRAAVPEGRLTGVSEDLGQNWEPALTAGGVLAHVPLVTSFPYYMVDSPMWSLVHEMRISLVFPLLALLVLRLRWAGALAVSAAVGVAGYALEGVLGEDRTSLALTLQFVVLFVLGIVLARHREGLVARYAGLPWWARLGGWALAGAGYVWPNLPLPAVLRGDPVADWMTGLGAAWLVIGVLGEPLVARAMRRRVPRRLGEISYSLYLVHLPVLLALLHLGQDRVPVAATLALALVLSLAAAVLVHRCVEAPSMRWARRVGRRSPGAAAAVRPAP